MISIDEYLSRAMRNGKLRIQADLEAGLTWRRNAGSAFQNQIVKSLALSAIHPVYTGDLFLSPRAQPIHLRPGRP